MKKFIVPALVIVVVGVLSLLVIKHIGSLQSQLSALQSKATSLEGKTFEGQLIDVKEEHKKLQDLKDAFLKAGGDERMKWLEGHSLAIQSLMSTGTVVQTGATEGTGTSF